MLSVGFMKIVKPTSVLLTPPPWSLHTLKPLGQGALPDLDCAWLHLVQVLIPVKPLPYSFTYHFLHFNCNNYQFFPYFSILLKCIDNIKLTSFKRHGSHESTLFDIWHILILLKRFQLYQHTLLLSLMASIFTFKYSSLVALYFITLFSPSSSIMDLVSCPLDIASAKDI